jgi:hypothetical protein
MSTKKFARNLLAGVTVLAPILTMVADAISRDREMDEIADRVVNRLEERNSNDKKMDGTEEKA